MTAWYAASALAGLPGMPGTSQGINKKGARGEIERRHRQHGKGWEYDPASLPMETQTALVLAEAKAARIPTPIETLSSSAASLCAPGDGTQHPSPAAPTPIETPGLPAASRAAGEPRTSPAAPSSAPPALAYDRDLLWADWDRRTSRVKARGERLVYALHAAESLRESGVKRWRAMKIAAAEHGFTTATLYRAARRVRGARRDDWLALLTPNLTGRAVIAACNPEAWETFKADYLRLEQPTASACYARLKRAAKHQNWTDIPSLGALMGRLKREIIPSAQIYKRQGEVALMRGFPPQDRTVTALHALEWINGDGYLHNVFVLWPGIAEPVRPKTWVWQDVYSRKILSWCTDLSENTDTIRRSFGQLVDDYGVPEHCTIDNTRAAANKWMTGGIPNRYRFKVTEDEPKGLLPLLGVQVHWTSVLNGHGHGQAKPVERAFGTGGIGEVVDKHPAFAGAWTGHNPMAKPEDYQSRAIPLAKFKAVMTAEIAAWNAQTGRRTEMGAGVKSFDDVFNASYAVSPIRRVTEEQRLMWLLAAETARVGRDGTVSIDAGGSAGVGRNRYFAPILQAHTGEKIVVRFDPDDLHGEVYLYTLAGAHLAMGACVRPAGFGDQETGRVHNKHRKRAMKASKLVAKANLTMTAIEAAGRLPDPVEAAESAGGGTPERRVVRMVQPKVDIPRVAESAERRVRKSTEERFARALEIEAARAAGMAVAEDDAAWLESYRDTPEYRSRKSMEETFGDKDFITVYA